MALCPDTGLLNLHDACVRSTWAALIPTCFVFAFCAIKFHPPFPAPIRRLVRTVQAPFAQFLTLREAEGLLAPGLEDIEEDDAPQYNIPVWRPLLAMIGLTQTVAWAGIAAFSFATDARAWVGISELLVSGTWLYTAVRAATHMSATPPYDLFALYIVYCVTAIIQVAGYIFEYSVAGTPLPGRIVVAGMCANVASTLLVLLAVLTMPLNVPSRRTDVAQIVRGAPCLLMTQTDSLT